jgi:hypothetical protein
MGRSGKRLDEDNPFIWVATRSMVKSKGVERHVSDFAATTSLESSFRLKRETTFSTACLTHVLVKYRKNCSWRRFYGTTSGKVEVDQRRDSG